MKMNELAQTGYENYYQMLSDKVRMDAYRKAIFQTVKKGDIVIDLGAGTGLLGIWAIQAGAAKVYAIEKTDAIELAKEIAKANHCLDKIIFIHKNSLDTTLPEKADVLISETLGSFAVDENTLVFSNDIRKRLLKPGGKIIPQSLAVYACPVEAPNAYNKIDFWRNIKGVDFSPAFDLFSRKIMVETIQQQSLLSQPVKLAAIDLNLDNPADFYARHYFPVHKKATLHGMAGWFEAKLADGIKLSTAPDQPATHWKQAFFPFRETIKVIKGDILDWSVQVKGAQKDSDHTIISYHYRCTQLINEPRPAPKTTARNQPCPCGSGKKYSNYSA